MTTDDKRAFALAVAAIADMVTGMPAQRAAEILASAVITVAKDRTPFPDRFVEYTVEMIEAGMTDAVAVHRSSLTQ